MIIDNNKVILMSELSSLQKNMMSIFNQEDCDFPDKRGIAVCERCIEKVLKRFDKQTRIYIYEYINLYKFDSDWTRTIKALENKGYVILKDK